MIAESLHSAPAFLQLACDAGETSGFLRPYLQPFVPWLYANSIYWTLLGLLANFLFSSRFILQWLRSEKEKRLVVPGYFWHLSFWGSVLNLIYAFHVDKLPFILAFCFLPFLYARNLFFHRQGGSKDLVGGAETMNDDEK